VLCCAVLCCAVLCCAVLCCAVLCCAVLCCAVMWCAVLRCDVMCKSWNELLKGEGCAYCGIVVSSDHSANDFIRVFKVLLLRM
jgi:hypothetical protein